MQSSTEIKRRIKTISETRQITKAMHLISSAKLNKAIQRHKANSRYFEKTRTTIKDILEHSSEKVEHKYCEVREDNRTAFIVISSDKGLCGAYNHNVLKYALKAIEENEAEEKYTFVIGQVARDFFLRREFNVDIEFLYASQNPTLTSATEIADDVLKLYSDEMMDEVYVIYTEMESSLKLVPKMIKLLPIERENFEGIDNKGSNYGDIIYHPSPKAVFDVLIPKFVVGTLYGALVQSFASEQQARLMAMDTATKNADEMIRDLQKEYNRVRQANITNEIAEITGGAEAIK
jgi:F-type H+-transporting ATPase subunit gamma